MLKLIVPGKEWFNDQTQEFVCLGSDTTLLLEHSLLSISKWEAKWKKSFFDKPESRTAEEEIDYVRCMTINQGVDRNIYYNLTADLMKQIHDYINDQQTATTITRHKKGKSSRRIVTSEVMYSWMIRYGIPFECQKWHLSRLMRLIEVCEADNGPAEKMSQAEIMKQNSALNAARRAKHKTKG